MGFEKSHLFGKVEVDVVSTSGASLAFSTDIPGEAMAQRFSMAIAITTRAVLRSRLPGLMQGHYLSATLTPTGAGQVELYGVRVWTRELPDGQWGWCALPVVATSPDYQPVPIPVEATPGEYAPVPIPVEATGAQYQPVPIPVEATASEYAPVPIPVEATAAEFQGVKIPIEATPESYNPLAIPVEATPQSFAPLSLPVKPTPPVPQWVQAPVDE
jgi:hypothetical protein